MSHILSQVDANSFTISAFIIGYLLIDDLSPAEQNSVGNWFMMVGQVLCTNSAQQQVINNQNNTSNSSNFDSPIINNESMMNSVKRSIAKMNNELNQENN